MDQRVGRGHRLHHERGREVGHEAQHDDDDGTEGPPAKNETKRASKTGPLVNVISQNDVPGIVECGRQGERSRAHDQIEEVDETGGGRVRLHRLADDCA